MATTAECNKHSNGPQTGGAGQKPETVSRARQPSTHIYGYRGICKFVYYGYSHHSTLYYSVVNNIGSVYVCEEKDIGFGSLCHVGALSFQGKGFAKLLIGGFG